MKHRLICVLECLDQLMLKCGRSHFWWDVFGIGMAVHLRNLLLSWLLLQFYDIWDFWWICILSVSAFFFSCLDRAHRQTDWLCLRSTSFPGLFYLRKWLEDTRLEATLAQGKGRGEEGVLPGVFGGEDEQPGSPYSELISNQICSFSTHFQAGSQNTEYW